MKELTGGVRKGGVEELSAFQVRIYNKFERRVQGFVRSRVFSDQDAEEVVSMAWELVWEHLPQFNQERATLTMFVFYWTDIARRRFFQQESSRLKHERPFPDGKTCVPESEGSQEKALVSPQLQPAAVVRDVEYSQFLLRRICAAPLAPHEIITYILVAVLGWKPRELVAEEHKSLAAWFCELEAELAGVLGDEIVPLGLQPLRAIINSRKELGQLTLAPKTRACWIDLLRAVVHETALINYFEAKRSSTATEKAQDCSNWVLSVRRHVRSELGFNAGE